MATQASGAVAITDGTISGLTQLGVSMANNTAMTGFSLGTITDTTSRPFTISQTWNNAGGTFTGLRFAATVTAANANSKLLDLLGGAAGTTSLAFVSSSGRFNCPGRFGVGEPAYAVDSSASNGMGASSGNGLEFWAAGGKTFSVLRAGTKANQAQIGSASAYAWNGTSINSTNTTADADLLLFRDAAGICAQRDGTAGQTKRIYGTYTDASNYTRLSLAATSTTAVVAAETAGTGADNIDLQLTPAGTGCVRFGSHSAIGAETVTGYITIKDAGGTERKVAIVS
jgi:hypothetical protein